ncbi:hypothetical protein [Candidatus Vallotia lariciata]|uniref:hypothetical protein n=1 Tax=Candidatus Vallotia laricis TaxID=2018052 RepID=UPI001D00279A|nr:hypothetical protein [Candidatus Vallotia lariciata]UDG83300.1 hypothetical protein GKR41_00696 [Candidatus Vallotia lariciata]
MNGSLRLNSRHYKSGARLNLTRIIILYFSCNNVQYRIILGTGHDSSILPLAATASLYNKRASLLQYNQVSIKNSVNWLTIAPLQKPAEQRELLGHY